MPPTYKEKNICLQNNLCVICTSLCSALLPLFTWINAVHKYKNKVTRENEVETDNSSRFMKNVHKVLKYRKKDNDYDLWMRHQRKLFQGYSNLGCIIWSNLKFADMKHPEPI